MFEIFEANISSNPKKLKQQEFLLKESLNCYVQKQSLDKRDQEIALSALCSCIISSTKSTCSLLNTVLGPLIVDFLYKISSHFQNEKLDDLETILKHEQICICLGYLNSFYLPCLSEYILIYLNKCGPPFKRMCLLNKISKKKSKRRKKMIPEWYSEILKTTYLLLKDYPSLLHLCWSWSDLASCFLNKDFNNNNLEGQWYLMKCLALFFGLRIDTNFLNNLEEKILFNLETQCENRILSVVDKNFSEADSIRSKRKEFDSFIKSSSQICSVSSILLHKQQFVSTSTRVAEDSFIITGTNKEAVELFALAVSQGKAVLLEGPVGCGKTALVEHVASLTGHTNSPYLSKIQLSDDTDSKALAGTYVCSNIPGQFVWQSGMLVRACQLGYWLLLEDIDMAPMDVISLILPMVESGQFVVPGQYDKSIAVSPGFRLFMTRRNASSNTFTSSAGVNMLLKHATVIKLNEIPEDDLKKIIVSRYPDLSNVVDKLLTIYKNLKTSRELQHVTSFVRKPSTRDLLKWCDRVSRHIATQGADDIGLTVALSAMDCFVASCPDPDIRMKMTETITVELNIGGDKAEYYCNSYKPAVEQSREVFQVGHSSLRKVVSDHVDFHAATKQLFAFTRHSSVLLERISACVSACEPVLLVGETGVGKTSALQYLAQETGRQLHVINMSQQSSSSDLLGGYKPAQLRHLIAPVREEFERLFPDTFSRKQNLKFLSHIQSCFSTRRYKDLWQLMMHSAKAAIKMVKKEKKLNKALLGSWQRVLTELNQLRLKLKSDSPIAFNFVEGKLSRCVERGDWLLLDEINLAAADTLECLSCVLESESGSIVLLERGDAKPLARHKEFRLFAAMNPATDVGKRNLPEGVQNRFTEIFVDEPADRGDIATIVAYYLNKRTVTALQAVDGIVQFYFEVRKISDKLTDGTGRKPHYSLRTLCRALRYVVDNTHVAMAKALFEGFCLSFLTALDRCSHPTVVNLIMQHVMGVKNLKSVLQQPMPKPDYESVCIQGHHVRSGPLKKYSMPHYILTPSVKNNLQDLARPVSYGKYPILIQGETSTGKTSLIKYLASATGNKAFRINNHEHTDLQEYVGYYASDKNGKLVFQDGPLVTAMREGHWVILDELNLAPTDILEALNRVLDDNRELFITETQEVVHAHPSFTLFATQNPPGLYGGRKILSRAFRNRFVELHFDEIPTEELETILHKRCGLAPSHCKKLIKVMLDLQARRKASGLFSGKHGFMTLRDLFRWAERHRRVKVRKDVYYDWEQHLVDDGYLLLAGKVRKVEEEKVIEGVLKKHFKRSVDKDKLFGLNSVKELANEMPEEFGHVVWTRPMRRLYVTLERALRFDEPVLLVGETGGGKTTACQLISRVMKKKLSIVNCHANTEAADFIGGLRPSRRRERSGDDENEEEGSACLFEWVDGPLVQAMVAGQHILIDEISLADDSVLERLNSVLEPERILVIPDKASMSEDDLSAAASSLVTAKKGFQFLATMNPGGDYGKKELSPALRNRMTEIWCDVIHDEEDLTSIVKHNLNLPASFANVKDGAWIYAKMVVEFVSWFKSTLFGIRFVVSVRDLITWSNFMGGTSCYLDLPSAYLHAACLVYIDGLGSGLSGAFAARSSQARAECLRFVLKQLKKSKQLQSMDEHTRHWLESEIAGREDAEKRVLTSDGRFHIHPFSIKLGPESPLRTGQFTFGAHTTSINALRVMRALQLPRPILLEGSPGGGKTSLVAAIARAAQYKLVRINLSEQTDASDLFGADLPSEGGKGGEFSWRDGPLLAALKAGHWVVLDELNLASQSVLESLNSVTDHRAEVYVPELDRRFLLDRSQTKIFACQNPLQEGGGRKGLPKSFLNRFTQVYVENLSRSDLLFILSNSHSQLSADILRRMVDFNQQVYQQVACDKTWAHRGAPWEFNLRDLTRWSDLILEDEEEDKLAAACKSAYLVYSERLRSAVDRRKLSDLFLKIFGKNLYTPSRYFHINNSTLQIGNAVMDRGRGCYPGRAFDSVLIPSLLHPAESLMRAMKQNWPCIVTGPSCSGKSLLVHTVAGLAGRRLRTLSMNSGMDAIELLGGYEQSDAGRLACEVLDDVIESLNWICQENLLAKDFKDKLFTTQKIMTSIGNLRILSASESNQSDSANFLANIEREMEAILQLCKSANLDFGVHKHLQELVMPCRLVDNLTKLKSLSLVRKAEGSYRWSDSLLVRALRNGDWLLIDGANFCAPSVLDRLNGLLEPGGILTVTERGVVDGNVPEVKPHEDFRLILALDPAHGELSRAMRNRCVEIHVPGELFNDTDTPVGEQTCAPLEGLTWDEVKQINVSKCLNAEELRMLDNFLQTIDMNSTSKTTVMSSFDQIIARRRCALQYNQSPAETGPSISDHLSLIIRPPSVRDFIFNPALSLLLRQVKIFEHSSRLNRLGYDMGIVLASMLRVLVETSSEKDRVLRRIAVEEILSRCPLVTDAERWISLFSNLIESLFCKPLSSFNQLQNNSLPWDLRHAPQSQKAGDLDPATVCRWDKILLNVVFLLSTFEDVPLNISYVRNKKNFLVDASTFQLADSFSSGKLSISDLPHTGLAYLVPLHQIWEKFVRDVLSSYDDQSLVSIPFPRSEGCLRRISFIWRIFMNTNFNVSSFVMWYLLLKKEMTSFAYVLRVTTATSCVALFDVLDSLNREFGIDNDTGKEYKLQDKARDFVVSSAVGLFANERQCVMTSCFYSLLRDVSGYVASVRRPDGTPKVAWTDVSTILSKFFDLYQAISTQHQAPSCSPMEVDNDENDVDFISKSFTELISSCQYIGVGFSTESLHLLKVLDLESNSISAGADEKSISSSASPCVNTQLSSLYDFYLLASQLHLYSSAGSENQLEFANLLPHLTSADVESCFRSLIFSARDQNLFNTRSYLSWKMLKRTQASDEHPEEEAESSRRATLNANNLLKPFICQAAIEILYKNSSKRASTVASLSELQVKTLDKLRVSLSDVTEKSRELDEFRVCLWKNATSSCHTNCTGSTLTLPTPLLNCIIGVVSSLGELISACFKFGEKIGLDGIIASSCGKLHAALCEYKEKHPIPPSNQLWLAFDKLNYILKPSTSHASEPCSEWSTSVVKTASLCTDSLIKITEVLTVEKGQVLSHAQRKDALLQCWQLCGKMWVWCGYFHLLLLTPRGSVDPVERRKSKAECYSAELKQIECDLKVRDLSHQLLTGRPLILDGVVCSESLHPHIQMSLNYLAGRRKIVEKNEFRAAFRPPGGQFLQLTKDCSSFLKTVCNLSLLEDTVAKISENSNPVAIKIEEKLQQSYESFTRSLTHKYPAYPDFVEPLIDAVSQVRCGLRLVHGSSSMLTFHLRQQTHLSRLTNSPITPEQFLVLYLHGSHAADDVNWFVSLLKSMQSRSISFSTNKIIADLLMCSFIRLRNKAMRSTYSSSYFNDLVRLAEIVVVMWNKREKRREERAAEKATLFKYKQRIHLIDDDDLKEKKEFKAMFPNFDKDIANLIGTNGSNDDVEMKDETKEDEEEDEDQEDEDVHLPTRAFDLVAIIHTDVAKKMIASSVPGETKTKRTATDKGLCRDEPCSDFLLPVLFSHATLSLTTSRSLSSLLGAELDHALIGRHVIACHRLNEALSSQRCADTKKTTMNVYVDSLPKEVTKCLGVLRHFRSTLTGHLLEEWPDHPVLSNVLTIIDRISTYPVTSPLMKFVAGLEALLKASQEWEANASRQVSLSKHLEAVSSLVIEWRKLELKSWFRLLDGARQRAAGGMTRWWFHIYQLVEGTSGDAESKVPPAELITSLQKFVESATIGQFKSRVDLLHAFYCHLVVKGKDKDQLATALFNLKSYYGQFVVSAEERISFLRKPIETELKEFVKIAKWNDINFYSLKESVEKTHQTLFKLTRKFSRALLEPVRSQILNITSPQFTPPSQNTNSAGLSIVLRWKEVAEAENTINPCPPPSPGLCRLLLSEVGDDAERSELRRLPTILPRIAKYSRSWMADVNGFLPGLLIDFENCIGNLIVNFKELRALEPSTPLSKDEELRNKRLSEAKHIHARKRRALADLFRLLRVIGLSYRKGLIWEKTCDPNQAMLTPSPRCGSQAIESAHSPIDELSSSALSGSQSYFFKMLSRWSTLLAAVTTPNKDVVGAGLDRLRGFVGHVVSIALIERQNMSRLFEGHRALAALLRNLKKHVYCGADRHPPSAEVALNKLLLCRKMTDVWMEALLHFKELMNCSPKSFTQGFTFSNPAPRIASCCYGDQLWNDVMKGVEEEIARAEETSLKLTQQLECYTKECGEIKPGLLVLPDLLLAIQSSVTSLRQAATRFCGEMCDLFDDVRASCADSSNALTHSPLLFDLIEGKNAVLSYADDVFLNQGRFPSGVSRDEILSDLNEISSRIMLAIQHLVKNIDGVENAISTDEGLLEFHFLHHMHNRSSQYFHHLNLESVQDNVMKLMEKVGRFVLDHEDTTIFSLVLRALVPLLQEYLAMCRYTLLLLSVINRSSCKFAYILASIASELVQKGFCPPPEFEEEISEKGEFKEVDDAGIGEGEGKKDVSEQIEQEDQVEDRPDENKEDQKDEIPPEDNAIEMSNDFEGKFQDDAPPDKENEDKGKEDEEKELDKQMGDLGDEQEVEKLDERMWGSDNDDDDDENESKDDKREEKGKGVDSEESQLLAKDDQLKDETGGEEDQGDQSEFNPDERDDVHEKDSEENPEPLDLPDGIDMDGGGVDEEKETEDSDRDDQEGEKLDEEDFPPDREDASKEKEAGVDEDKGADKEEGDEDKTDGNDSEKISEDEEQKEAGEQSASDESDKDEADLSDHDNDDDDGLKEEESTDPVKRENAEEEKELEEKKQDDDEDNKQKGQGTQLPIEENKDEEDQEKIREETKRSDRIDTEDNVEQSETADEEVMKQAAEDGENRETSGMAPSADVHGEHSELAAPQSVQEKRQEREKPSENERKMGESDSKRSLGEAQDILPKKLKLMDGIKEEEEGEGERNDDAEMYQHVTDDVKQYDKQTRDAATEEQMRKQPIEMEEEKDPDINFSDDNADDENKAETTYVEANDLDDLKDLQTKPVSIEDEEMVIDASKDEVVEDKKSYRVINEEGEIRDLPSSSIHANILEWDPSSEFKSLTPDEVASLRKDMEDHLRSVSKESDVELLEAETMWQQYQTLTQPLSQQLSEQLRLILEPTRAAKLKGDYRSGKRLNMRKVIPYIASGFRKDKIWLRRSKPSKREYQIMVAMDDSSSMSDNHTKQLAFESLAVISTALTTIEAGQLSVCRFGEEAKLLHDFHQPFTDRSGASILQQCSFRQEQTKVAKMLETCVKFLKAAQTSFTSSADPRLSQLLVIVSDGRGIYIEGREKVEAAVRAAKDARVFLAFVILDNPAMKDSILDIKTPVFKEDGKIDIRSYMCEFPFPFYVIIRDINSLPETLSEALRQWFEIVASGE